MMRRWPDLIVVLITLVLLVLGSIGAAAGMVRLGAPAWVQLFLTMVLVAANVGVGIIVAARWSR